MRLCALTEGMHCIVWLIVGARVVAFATTQGRGSLRHIASRVSNLHLWHGTHFIAYEHHLE